MRKSRVGIPTWRPTTSCLCHSLFNMSVQWKHTHTLTPTSHDEKHYQSQAQWNMGLSRTTQSLSVPASKDGTKTDPPSVCLMTHWGRKCFFLWSFYVCAVQYCTGWADRTTSFTNFDFFFFSWSLPTRLYVTSSSVTVFKGYLKFNVARFRYSYCNHPKLCVLIKNLFLLLLFTQVIFNTGDVHIVKLIWLKSN